MIDEDDHQNQVKEHHQAPFSFVCVRARGYVCVFLRPFIAPVSNESCGEHGDDNEIPNWQAELHRLFECASSCVSRRFVVAWGGRPGVAYVRLPLLACVFFTGKILCAHE